MKASNRILWIILGVSLFLGGCAGYIVATGPPPRPAEVAIVAPSSLHVWIPGHYTYSGGTYVWVQGYYTVPPRGKTWVAGRWEKTPRGYKHHKGHWRKKHH